MSATHAIAGTTVEPTSHEDDERFTIHPLHDDNHVCSGPGCNADTRQSPDDLSLLLGADMDGMAADYGEVAFCSVACAQAFVEKGHLHDIDAAEQGVSTVIHSSASLATVRVEDTRLPDFQVLGFDRSNAISKTTDALDTKTDTLSTSLDGAVDITVEPL